MGVPYTYELFRRLHLFDDRALKPGEHPWYQHLRYMTQAGGQTAGTFSGCMGTDCSGWILFGVQRRNTGRIVPGFDKKVSDPNLHK